MMINAWKNLAKASSDPTEHHPLNISLSRPNVCECMLRLRVNNKETEAILRGVLQHCSAGGAHLVRL